MNIVFFGSFQHYSTLILESLHHCQDITVAGVVTTPPMPAGRDKKLTQTHVHQWALYHQFPVFTPTQLTPSSLKIIPEKPDFFIVAGYSKLLPQSWLDHPRHGCLNLHFSLLPKFRGANPAEWAILCGETITGISLITMSGQFDTGAIIAQQPLTISPTDNRESLYHKLYTLGAQELPAMLIKYHNWLHKQTFACQASLTPQPQPIISPTPIAMQFKRPDGFIPWILIQSCLEGQPLDPTHHLTSHLLHAWAYSSSLTTNYKLLAPDFVTRAVRALYGFPGFWTTVNTTKGKRRLKIHTAVVNNHKLVLQQVQLAGQITTDFNQIKNQLLPL